MVPTQAAQVGMLTKISAITPISLVHRVEKDQQRFSRFYYFMINKNPDLLEVLLGGLAVTEFYQVHLSFHMVGTSLVGVDPTHSSDSRTCPDNQVQVLVLDWLGSGVCPEKQIRFHRKKTNTSSNCILFSPWP